MSDVGPLDATALAQSQMAWLGVRVPRADEMCPPQGVGDLLRLEVGHGAGGCLRAGIHEGISGVVPQGGKCPGGVADVLGHAPGQVCQQLQRCSRQEWLAWHVCQLGKCPAYKEGRDCGSKSLTWSARHSAVCREMIGAMRLPSGSQGRLWGGGQGADEGLVAYQRALLVACGRKVLMMPAAWWPRRSRRSPLGWYPRVAKAVQASSA